MSIGNLKTDGGKGTNFPWQHKMLKGFGQLISLSGGGSNPCIRRTSIFRTTLLDTLRNAYSVSFENTGTADAIVGGAALKPGEKIYLDGNGCLLADITYDARTAGAELLVAAVIV